MKTCVLALEAMPATLRDDAMARRDRVAGAQPDVVKSLEQRVDSRCATLFCVSEFLARVVLRQGDDVAAALDAGRFDAAPAATLDPPSSDPSAVPDSCAAPTLDELPEVAPEEDLRRQRNLEQALIAWHDLLGHRDTVQTLHALSDLADGCVRLACRHALEADGARHTGALAPPLVVAMGKLGGRELNFSSDVDLVILHPDHPEHERRYVRLAQQIVRWLDAPTAAGRVCRVDVRLRPFGGTGPLSLSLNAFERYLQTHARDWERYAYVKARVLTGKPDDVERLEDMIRGFVYRRYLDFGVFDALRDTKSLIEAEVERRDRRDDLKRGSGGIREIEFVAQAFQLLRGGRLRALQTRSLHEAVAGLDAAAGLSPARINDLLSAYDYLRHVENRVQMHDDRQVHSLPDDEAGRARVAASLGVESEAMLTTLSGHRQRVRAVFNSVLATDEPDREARALRALWQSAADPDALASALQNVSPVPDEPFASALASLGSSRSLARLDAQSRARLDRLMPALIAAALHTPRPGRTLTRLARVVEGVGRRSAYFALLNERPQARQRLVDLCAASRRITNDVAEHPLLLDSLIRLNVDDLPDTSARGTQLADALHGIEPGDMDALTDALAQFKGGAQFEVAVADLSSQLPIMRVSDHLTAIAESVLEAVFEAARRDIERRYGRLPGNGGQFCVVAYGKLGGIELGYGSDLDLVFLYDDEEVGTPAVSDGPRGLDSSMYFARLVQRFVGLATATTRAGTLFDVDMRLRPSGNSGPLVSRLSAYAGYQRERAWTWEHQALLRARAVVGDASLAARFDALRREVLCTAREPAALRKDVLTMRTRMAKAHRPAKGRFHVKHDAGGLTDVEFLVQHALLAGAAKAPDLVRFSDHVRHLDALIRSRQLGEQVAEALRSAYLDYRTHLHRRALDDGEVVVADDRFAEHRERVRDIWQAQFG